MVGVVSGGGAAGLRRGRGVAARPEAVGVVLGEGSAASFIGGQGGGGVLAGGKLAGGLMAGAARLCAASMVAASEARAGHWWNVNGARKRSGEAKRHHGRPPQAALCRGRRRCAASTAVGRGVGARSARAGARGCAQWQCGRRGGSSGARESGVPGACARTAFAWARLGGGVSGEQRAAGARVGVRRAAVGRARARRRGTGRAGRAARPELGPRAACPGGGRGRVSRGRGEGAGQARGRGGRREKREGEKRKEKEENGKKKRKRKRRGKRREKGERERGIRAGITALIAEPVGHAWRPGARKRGARVEGKTGRGCRVFGEIERSGGTGKIPENWG